MVIACDTSFLFSLYGNDAHSARAVAWAARASQPIVISPLNVYELGNALRFAEFRKFLRPGQAAQFLSEFEAALEQGRLLLKACNLAEVISTAKRLSAAYTLRGGHRAFDVLHVAAALQMVAKEFLSFDDNQKKLARAEGLSVLPR